jgi:hypothetical protein
LHDTRDSREKAFNGAGRVAEDAEKIVFSLATDPGGIGSAFHRAGEAGKGKASAPFLHGFQISE